MPLFHLYSLYYVWSVQDRFHGIARYRTYASTATILLCVASVIIVRVMMVGIFGARIGCLVDVSGVLTLFSLFGAILEIPIVIPSIGLSPTSIWQLITGAILYKLGRDV